MITPCRRRVRFAKSGSSRMNRSGYAIVALPTLSLLHGFRAWDDGYTLVKDQWECLLIFPASAPLPFR